ncbi:Hypothetical predicted protein [Octopus vulgaris]|uniref:Uncharacterized protein n=1 Tax=Octopus vulgaris TaxID=6645 RepID=A0AA36EY94_OCTVU|nr:Hypothetical predicted protein [Octopus vulgaris]
MLQRGHGSSRSSGDGDGGGGGGGAGGGGSGYTFGIRIQNNMYKTDGKSLKLQNAIDYIFPDATKRYHKYTPFQYSMMFLKEYSRPSEESLVWARVFPPLLTETRSLLLLLFFLTGDGGDCGDCGDGGGIVLPENRLDINITNNSSAEFAITNVAVTATVVNVAIATVTSASITAISSALVIYIIVVVVDSIIAAEVMGINHHLVQGNKLYNQIIQTIALRKIVLIFELGLKVNEKEPRESGRFSSSHQSFGIYQYLRELHSD